MTSGQSAYLDFLRFTAALAVLLGHMDQDGLYMSWMPLAWFSHEAVVVFFVMSGFIIYSTTLRQHHTAMDYVVARMSRVYSVALPAILVCFLAAQLVPAEAAADGVHFSNYRPGVLTDFLSSLLFLNESWNSSAGLTMNVPYWSLCYEAWYYVLFGLYVFIDGRRRWFMIAMVGLIAGPAIMALAPIWIAGAWLAKDGRNFACSRLTAWLVVAASISMIVAINLSGIDASLRSLLHDRIPGFWRLEASQRLFTDYLIGLAIMANIAVFPSLNPGICSFFSSQRAVFRYLAGFSFTLYLFHRPITQFAGYYFPNGNNSIPYSIAMAIGILLICLSISYGTERQLPRWRNAISRLFSFDPKKDRGTAA